MPAGKMCLLFSQIEARKVFQGRETKMKRVMVLTMIVFHLCAVLCTVPLQAQEDLKIVHQPVIEAAVQKAISVTAELTGSAAGKLMYIMYRHVGKKNFASTSMENTGDSKFAGEIPYKKVNSEGLEYYVRVLDPVGNQLARYPVDGSYISVTVSPAESAEEMNLSGDEVAVAKTVVAGETSKEIPKSEGMTSPQISPKAESRSIVHQPVTESNAEQTISLTAELDGSLAGKMVYIMYRKTGEKDFGSVSMKNVDENAFAGEIPSKKVTPEGLEYYLRVIDPIGNQLARYPADESYIIVSVIPVKEVQELTLPEEETVTLAEEKPVIVPEKQKKTGLKKWHWIGIGSLVVVGIAAIAMSGGGGDGRNGGQTYTKLPDPPDRP